MDPRTLEMSYKREPRAEGKKGWRSTTTRDHQNIPHPNKKSLPILNPAKLPSMNFDDPIDEPSMNIKISQKLQISSRRRLYKVAFCMDYMNPFLQI